MHLRGDDCDLQLQCDVQHISNRSSVVYDHLSCIETLMRGKSRASNVHRQCNGSMPRPNDRDPERARVWFQTSCRISKDLLSARLMRSLLKSLQFPTYAVLKHREGSYVAVGIHSARQRVAFLHSSSISFNADPDLATNVVADASTSVQSKTRLPTSIKSLNKILSTQQTRELPEDELEEKFVRGQFHPTVRGCRLIRRIGTWWAMYQQDVLICEFPHDEIRHATESVEVCLTHLPTGIRVQCQPTRSLQQNRRAARRLLRDKVRIANVARTMLIVLTGRSATESWTIEG